METDQANSRTTLKREVKCFIAVTLVHVVPDVKVHNIADKMGRTIKHQDVNPPRMQASSSRLSVCFIGGHQTRHPLCVESTGTHRCHSGRAPHNIVRARQLVVGATTIIFGKRQKTMTCRTTRTNKTKRPGSSRVSERYS